MTESVYQTKQRRAWREGKGRLVVQPSARHEPTPPPVACVARDRLRRDDVIYFTTQLAVMIETGVTLAEALDAIADQARDPEFKAVTADLSEQVKSGVEFSAALERYPRSFGQLFIALMRASEVSGTMSQMLQRACDYLAQERETVKRVKGAMIYPICMLSFCTLVVIGLLIFILPRFERIYAGKGAVLPGPTRLLLALSHGMADYWYLVLTGAVGAVVGAVAFLRSPRGREFMDTVRVRMPVVGKMYRKAYLARSLRTMATMVSSGVSLLDGLEITAGVAGNRHFSAIWDAVAAQAKVGTSLSDELANHALIPGTVVHMVAAGEKTGQLAKVMDRVADFCEDELKIAVKAVTSLIEPLMIILMGCIIGGIAMALLLPVFSLSKLLH